MALSLKQERIDLRASSEQKTILETAAELNHISLSSYILGVVLKQAQFDIAENDRIVVSNKDRSIVMAALSNPPEPNEELRKLFS